MSLGAFSILNRQPFSPRFQALREWDTAVAVPEEPVTAVEFTIGLDLGKSQDYSALCIVQRTAPPQGEATYSVRHLHRWPLGTSFARSRKTLPIRLPPWVVLSPHCRGCDRRRPGGHGNDRRRASRKSRKWPTKRICAPIVIGGGHAVSRGLDMTYRIAKVQLVSVLQAMLSGHRLKIATGLPEAGVLMAELLAFSTKMSPAGNEKYRGSARAGSRRHGPGRGYGTGAHREGPARAVGNLGMMQRLSYGITITQNLVRRMTSHSCGISSSSLSEM